MKKLFLILALLPHSISAQQFPGMNIENQGEMKEMMEAMQKMQACMTKINKSELKTMQLKAEELNRESQELCKKGKRSQAQQNAQKSLDIFKNDPIAIKLRKCTEIIKDITSESEITEVHVCDTFQGNYKGYN